MGFFARRYAWAVTFGLSLAGMTAYTLLDAFVFPKVYAPVQAARAGQSARAGEMEGEEAAVAPIAGSNAADAVDAGEAADERETANAADASDTGMTAVTGETSDAAGVASAADATDAAGTAASPDALTRAANAYEDENIRISVEEVDEGGAVYYVADVRLSSAETLRTALAQGVFGKNVTQKTSDMARENRAILAINGDYYGFRDTGLIIRNGVLYRDNPRDGSGNQSLIIDAGGNLAVLPEGSVSGESLIAKGVWQSFSFGPALVEDGDVVTASASGGGASGGGSTRGDASGAIGKGKRGGAGNTQGAQPRTAIGQIAPLHYVFIVVDGRSDTSRGMTLEQLAQVFQARGCSIAYNLDGGGSSAMWFEGELVNHPTDGRADGERSISDIIYIGYAQGGGA